MKRTWFFRIGIFVLLMLIPTVAAEAYLGPAPTGTNIENDVYKVDAHPRGPTDPFKVEYSVEVKGLANPADGDIFFNKDVSTPGPLPSTRLCVVVLKDGSQYRYYDAVKVEGTQKFNEDYFYGKSVDGIMHYYNDRHYPEAISFELEVAETMTAEDKAKLFKETVLVDQGGSPVEQFPLKYYYDTRFGYRPVYGYRNNKFGDNKAYIILGPSDSSTQKQYKIKLTEYYLSETLYGEARGKTFYESMKKHDGTTDTEGELSWYHMRPVQLVYTDTTDAEKTMDVFVNRMTGKIYDKTGKGIADGTKALIWEEFLGNPKKLLTDIKSGAATVVAYPLSKADSTIIYDDYEGPLNYSTRDEPQKGIPASLTSIGSDNVSPAATLEAAKYLAEGVFPKVKITPAAESVTIHFVKYVLYDEENGKYVLPEDSEDQLLNQAYTTDVQMEVLRDVLKDTLDAYNTDFSTELNGKEYVATRYDAPKKMLVFNGNLTEAKNGAALWYRFESIDLGRPLRAFLQTAKVIQGEEAKEAGMKDDNPPGSFPLSSTEIVLAGRLKYKPPYIPTPPAEEDEDDWLTLYTPEDVTVDGPMQDFNGAVEARIADGEENITEITFHDENGDEVKTSGTIRVQLPVPEGVEPPYRVLVDDVYTTFEEVDGKIVFMVPPTDGTEMKELTATYEGEIYRVNGTDFDLGDAVSIKVWKEEDAYIVKLLNSAEEEVHSKGYVYVTLPVPEGVKPPFRVLVDGVYTTFESPEEGFFRFGAKF